MTPTLMAPEVRNELASLSRKAKAEFRAWLNNKFQAVCTTNGNEADDPKLPQAVRANARLRNRIMAEFINDLDSILALNSTTSRIDQNKHLGAVAEHQPEEHVRD